MLRIWGRIMQGSRMISDHVAISENSMLSLNQRLEDCMEELCSVFDLPKPIWMENNYRELDRFGQTTFTQDHFVESLGNRRFEIEIIEMDDDQ